MDLPGYIAVTRLSGLDREMTALANNLANLSTPGYRAEGLIFSELVRAVPGEGGSVSMTAARTRHVADIAGPVRETGQPLDLAISGEGFFLVETGRGQALTRAGNFTLSPEGAVILPTGAQLL
ncbi:MAG: flagellar hook-basal body complex protein, partial [Rubricella sp.]